MFTVTLLTDPNTKTLTHRMVENLRSAWGGDQTRWLSPKEAAEFSIERLPDNQWSVWEDLQGLQIDLCVQKSDARKKKILIADMDSTMIAQECIDELAVVAGVGEQVAEVTRIAMDGGMDFVEALNARLSLMAGADQRIIDDVLRTRIDFVSGGSTLLATMKANGGYSALVSGGFTAFAGPISSALGFDEFTANVLAVSEGKLTGTIVGDAVGKQTKVDRLMALCREHNVNETDVIAVGDGANDLGMLSLAGTGVALHAKPSVAAQCDIRINFGNLTSLLYLQGYSSDDFVAAPSPTLDA